MTFAHEAVAALPTGGNADAAAIRAMCERRFAYVLDTSESAASFVAVDPVSGTLPLYLIQSGILFQYDSTDSTTVADGVTCLVSSEGKRYKTNGVSVPYAVLSRSTSAQPGSPSVGDTYIVPTAATGAAWSGQDGKIAIYTARGWQFAVSPIGREIYVRDVDSYYHRNASGVWTAGVGALVLSANSVTLQNVLGANASFQIKVENQTTNTPPGSPSPPTAYIIGSSPTGAWSGNAGKLAICLSGTAFTIIAPVAGDQVYDKARNAVFQFDGTTWKSTNGVFADTARATNASITSFSTQIPFDDTIPQQTEGTQVISLNFTPKSITNKLRVRFKADISTNSAAPGHGIASLFQDSNSNAIKATSAYFGAASSIVQIALDHEYVPGTTSLITLAVRLGSSVGGATVFPNGTNGSRVFGGSGAMSLTVDEIIA